MPNDGRDRAYSLFPREQGRRTLGIYNTRESLLRYRAHLAECGFNPPGFVLVNGRPVKLPAD